MAVSSATQSNQGAGRRKKTFTARFRPKMMKGWVGAATEPQARNMRGVFRRKEQARLCDARGPRAMAGEKAAGWTACLVLLSSIRPTNSIPNALYINRIDRGRRFRQWIDRLSIIEGLYKIDRSIDHGGRRKWKHKHAGTRIHTPMNDVLHLCFLFLSKAVGASFLFSRSYANMCLRGRVLFPTERARPP